MSDCTCTDDETSDGSATYEDDPYCPIHGIAAEISQRLAESERMRRQLAEALRRIEHAPFDVMEDAEADLRRIKTLAREARLASDALDKEAT